MTAKVISFPTQIKKSNTTSGALDSLQRTFRVGRRQHVINLPFISLEPGRASRIAIVSPNNKKCSS
jgi:hypothetical protein